MLISLGFLPNLYQLNNKCFVPLSSHFINLYLHNSTRKKNGEGEKEWGGEKAKKNKTMNMHLIKKKKISYFLFLLFKLISRRHFKTHHYVR